MILRVWLLSSFAYLLLQHHLTALCICVKATRATRRGQLNGIFLVEKSECLSSRCLLGNSKIKTKILIFQMYTNNRAQGRTTFSDFILAGIPIPFFCVWFVLLFFFSFIYVRQAVYGCMCFCRFLISEYVCVYLHKWLTYGTHERKVLLKMAHSTYLMSRAIAKCREIRSSTYNIV